MDKENPLAITCNPSAQTDTFFGLPPWWKYIKSGYEDQLGNCIPILNFSQRPYEIWGIGLAVVDMLLRFAGIAAVIFVIMGGINYITSAGNPEQIANARKRIINALIGLAIVIVAIGFVSFLGKRIG